MSIAPLQVFDEHLRSLLEVMLHEGVIDAARGFSKMVGKKLNLSQPQVSLMPLDQLPLLLGGPETEAVGIYLRTHGEIAGQMMLVLSHDKALELVDLILDETPGTTTALGSLERSALAELGNLTGTFFLNALAASTGLSVRPSPPAVMVDMIGAILDVVVATYGGVGPNVLMLHVMFLSDEREAQADFWVIPDPVAIEALARRDPAHER